jgi:hypothetical protein
MRNKAMKDEIIGKRFNKLIVVKRMKDKRYSTGTIKKQYLCLCDCGNYKIVSSKCLYNKATGSCGCLTKKPKNYHKTHGLSKTKLYHIWGSMKRRCEKPKDKAYYNYGFRGIKVCDEWHDFNNFYEWCIQNGYSEGLSLDRINNNGNYEPNNCRWVDRKVQNNNTRANVIIEVNSERHTLSEWSKLLNVSYDLLHSRVRYYGIVPKVITEPYRVNLNSKYVYVDKYGEYQKRVQHE